MAEGVVDHLEAVDVEIEHREAEAGLTPGASPGVVQPIEEERAVGQAGERIVHRLVLQARLERGPLGGGALALLELEAQVVGRPGQLLGAGFDLFVQSAPQLFGRGQRLLQLSLLRRVLPA